MLGFTPTWIEEIIKTDPSITSYWDVITNIAEDSGKIGNLKSLTTTEKGSVVEAINYLNSKIGEDFTVTSKNSSGAVLTTLLEGINLIGDMSSLTTTNKDTLVEAINTITTFTGYNSTNPIKTKN